ncbi:MAG: phosphoribosylglycinamide formyltransferase [Ideonella sp.]
MKRIVILISGRGSNMLAVAEACVGEAWPARLSAVISNRPDAAGLSAASARGLHTAVVDHRNYPDREAFDAALLSEIERHAPDLVVLAGFMRILTPPFVERFAGRLVNVHPSLLPSFTGLHTHRRALEAGCKLAGATVHFVTPDLDVGPIIAQAMVPVLPDDDESSLAERVLQREHRMLPQVIRWLVEDQLTIDGGIVRHREGKSQLF